MGETERPKIENVSDTALWVAVYRALESRRPDALFHDPLSMKIAGERGRRIAASMPHGSIMAWILAMRTVSIDELIEDAIARGIDTVLNLGAGLDTRPYRMKLPATLRWIEVDFPHLIDFKELGLKGEVPHCKLERVSLDLSDRKKRQDFFARIGAESRRVLVITEGVLIYLTNDQARELAEDLASVPSFEFWIQDFLGGNTRRILPRKIKKRLQSAPFRLELHDWFGFFENLGWVAERKIYSYDQSVRLKRKPPFPKLFWVLYFLMPKSRKENLRKQRGYVLLKRKS